MIASFSFPHAPFAVRFIEPLELNHTITAITICPSNRADLPLTVDGLKECFYSIVSLQAVGVRAVTCNMCGGKIPTETDPLESILCDRYNTLIWDCR